MIYSLNGERCTSSSRLLVQRSIHEEFTERLAERVRSPQGRSSARPGHRDRPAHPPRPLRQGAQLRGGRRSEGRDRRRRRRGRHRPGVVLRQPDDVRRRDATTCASPGRRSSGPCSPSSRSTTRPMRVALANDTDYGLAGYLWTGDAGRAHRVARDLDVGHGVGQLAERAPPADTVRRHEGERHRPRRRRLLASTSTWRRRTSPSPTTRMPSRRWVRSGEPHARRPRRSASSLPPTSGRGSPPCRSIR